MTVLVYTLTSHPGIRSGDYLLRSSRPSLVPLPGVRSGVSMAEAQESDSIAGNATQLCIRPATPQQVDREGDWTRKTDANI